MTHHHLLQSSIDSEPDIIIPSPDEFSVITVHRETLPVCAVIVRPRHHSIRPHWSQSEAGITSMKLMRREILKNGIREENIGIIRSGNSIDESVMHYSEPRRLKWRELPLVTKPEFTLFHPAKAGILTDGFTRCGSWNHKADEKEIIRETLRSSGILILEHPDIREQDIADFARLAEMAPDARLYLCDGISVRHVTRNETGTAARAWEAHHRFMRAYSLNARILYGRALTHAMRETCADSRIIRDALGLTGCNIWNPWATQVLHYLRNRRPGYISSPTSLPPSSAASFRASERAGLCQLSDEGLTWIWKGSGKYPEWNEKPVQAADGSVGTENRLGNIRHTGNRKHTIFYLEHMKLIGAGDGEYGLTETGIRYLDILGKDNCDPDILLRWLKPDDRIGGPEDVPSMDRWLNRNFRAVKRRVADFPAAALRGLGNFETPLPSRDDRNHTPEEHRKELKAEERSMTPVIVGRILKCTPFTMNEQGFPESTVKDVLSGNEKNIKTLPMNGIAYLWAGVLCSRSALDEDSASVHARAQEAVSRMPTAIAGWKGTLPFGEHALPATG